MDHWIKCFKKWEVTKKNIIKSVYYGIVMPNLVKLAYILLLIDLFTAPMRNYCDRAKKKSVWSFLWVYLFLDRLHTNQWFPECSLSAYLYVCIPVYIYTYICIYVWYCIVCIVLYCM